MRDYLVGLLTLAGWSVDAVADGDAALAAARLAPPDLLLADVMMPGRDGLALVAALRREPRLATMPRHPALRSRRRGGADGGDAERRRRLPGEALLGARADRAG
ncbi:response regulator [Dankookia sp. P2]|uniref:response regulator n=1 Tax=Dankookia sp. P2 TaxID=3423955 RepID=UPI003D669823